MRIFISWSGNRSRVIALGLKKLLNRVIQQAEPWLSVGGIERGSQWQADVTRELARAQYGIVCLTPENVDSPWIHFEAGALSNTIGTSGVCPYLYGLEHADIKFPLAQFEMAKVDHDETFQLFQTINRGLGASMLADDVLHDAFEAFWGEYQASLAAMPEADSCHAAQTDRDLLNETLSTVRSMSQNLDSLQSTPTHVYGGTL